MYLVFVFIIFIFSVIHLFTFTQDLLKLFTSKFNCNSHYGQTCLMSELTSPSSGIFIECHLSGAIVLPDSLTSFQGLNVYV